MKKAALALFLSYGLFVAWASLSPGSGSVIGSGDKLAHLLTYAVFALLGWRLGLPRLTFLWLCIGLLAYSGLLEVGQSFIPGRTMSGLDLLANGAGILLGSLACVVFTRR